MPGFNPRARAGRDRAFTVQVKQWGVFQSTRPRRARPRTMTAMIESCWFQSTRPRRARLTIRAHYEGYENVSIHAPAQGATGFAKTVVNVNAFQSTRPRRARLIRSIYNRHMTSFQSTRPRRARLALPELESACTEFQSTRPRRARLCFLISLATLTQFQSTRPRRARLG